ncbi:MAG TPA: hypothetical protein VJL58_06475 [Pyrinomonadaceae bacterium]|nr:hypothetical protein [Pyrinomonadaceae bacterium]
MGKTSPEPRAQTILPRYFTLMLSALVGLIYYVSNTKPQHYYDYTFRVAENLLRGQVGFTLPQPSWLNEFVPFEGFYYSVFPLGSVVSMLPFAFLKLIGLIDTMPGAFIAGLCAAISCYLFLWIAKTYEVSESRALLMSLAMMFGTFAWTNLTIAGAWQLALGFALVGELGAIYFTVYDRRPVIAGIFFALAFGNRTEILLTAPVFFYLLYRGDTKVQSADGLPTDGSLRLNVSTVKTLLAFCSVPFVLGVLTLIYNYVRFHSISDFGYARIPGVLNEPWYNHGIFSVYYIPRQAWEMLLRPWEIRNVFPYFAPNGFSSSILLSSPFLLFALRLGSRDRALKYVSWIAVIILTILLWMHGNSGGWQFGYRYAIVLLPWLFVIMLESAPKNLSPLEWTAYGFSFLANAYATWLFHYTNYPGR